jgi:signal transduction histidine kinase
MITEHLFDFDLAAYYVFTWLMSLGTAAGVFLISFLLAFIFPLDLFIKALLLVISSTALAALFPWYFSKYEDWSNKHILHGKYDYLKIMPQKATDWLKHLDLGELIKAVTNDFKGVMGFEDVKIFLYGDYAIGSHEAARNCYFINPDNLDDEGVFNISKETALVKFAEAQNRPIYLNDLNKEIQSKGVRRSVRRAGEQVIKEMEDLKFEAVLPLSYGDGRTNNFVGFIGFGRWLGKREETIIEDKDKKFFEKLGTVLETAFRHALENRKADILDQKKSTMISDTMDEVQKLGEEKTKLEKELAKSKSRTLSFADMASEYATKIQILNESMEDLEAVTRYSQSAVLTIRNNLIKTANRQARHMLVGIGGKIVGEPFEKILSKQFRNTEQIIEDIKKVIETGASSGVFETEWVQDGRKVPVEIKIMPLKDRFEIGQVNGALVEIIDITHAKEREKLLHLRDKFETFRDVLEGLRHELNNAMNILSSYSYAVKNLKPEAINNEDFKKDFCTVIPKTAKFVSELLDNLAAAHTPLVMDGAVEVGIPEVLEETLKIFMPRWEAANIKVEKNISPVPRIKIRPELLKTIFYELVKNSIEAIEEYDYQRQLGQVAKTGGTIWISLKTNDAGEIEIEVKDNGIGIDEVNLAKVLNPFYTTKIHSVTHPETGTGLGLNKVYNIVQAFNGNLQITSKLGEGTKVILSLKPII